MKLPPTSLLAATLLSVTPAFIQAAESNSKPNIILLLIDDLGIGDISSFAANDLETPNIDSLAKTGVRFSNGYAVAPICSPSRAATITGIYPQRFNVFGNADRGRTLPQGHPTLAQTLKQAGYATGMIGRWDLGDHTQGPFETGFDEVAKRPRGMPFEDRPPASQAHPREKGVTYLGRDGSYWTDVNRAELAEFVRRHKEHPFYLYFAPLAVHFPVHDVPQKYLDRVPPNVQEKRRPMAATIIALDDAIGTLLDTLKSEKLFDNTLIFFMGDNGGSPDDGSLNGPLRGGKQTQWDGAFRVPFIVSWPEKIPGHRTLNGLVSTLDVYPTAAAAAGAAAPPTLDGANLLPYLTGKADHSPHEAIYFRWFDARTKRWDMRAVRSGPWRLLTHAPGAYHDLEKEAAGLASPDQFVTALYNIEDDPGETKDLAAEHPGIVKELVDKLSQWEKDLPPIDRTRKSPTPQAKMPTGDGWAYKLQPETH
jgi:arylsulfatase A-like enzyme